MIGWLRGVVVDRPHPGQVVMNVNGVGYDVEVSLLTDYQLEMQKDHIELQIHTVVREDALLLYGFLTKDERALFRALIKVNGVGPKLAIAILSHMSPAEFAQAIQQENTLALNKLPGIGAKTAQRLVVEMKDTLSRLQFNMPESIENNIVNQANEAIFALEALGYKRQEASKAIKQLDDGTQSCEQLIRQALQVLTRY
jgi:holliday junction DNA helicase RuvA